MEQSLRNDHAKAHAAGLRPSPPMVFTPLELAAAEQLVHLSESSCSTGAAFTPRGSWTAASACYSSSSSPRSVNAPPAASALDDLVLHAMEEEEDDEDEQEVGGRPRRNRRYRSIADIYEATGRCEARRGKKAKAGGTMGQRRK